ncbi:hypothetical protein [Tenggerimyces flavus]|uniref:Uncharacterized protein n=1 Tax=Tenggerimyces flavus TaxID=1708749 RepID=A0ABV7YBK0_9ACTN|nr:hypothetical protein [Tenggerimyces flavus]MBM7787198.1 hypothetical protein [Tenggerimyces flavus]
MVVSPVSPVSPVLAHRLAGFVHELRQRTRRRLFPTVAFLQPLDGAGVPNGSRGPNLLTHVAGSGILVPDHALRVDLLLLSLGRASNPSNALVVTRSGVAESNPSDLAWWRAWRAACGIAEREVGPLLVVVREGWLDVPNDTSVTVPRLRNRRKAA